ncbi:DUF3575 domain-containing protein [Spirosoma koreense]
MKLLVTSLLLVAIVQTAVKAQWQSRIGLNLVPLAIRTVELTSEFSRHPAYALTFQTGYVFQSAFDGLSRVKVYDGISDRRSSGWFGKLGGRIYLLSLARKEPRFNLFVGAQLIASQYKQTGVAHVIDPGFSPYEKPYIDLQVKGFLWGTALSAGTMVRLSERFALDAGLQYGFQPTRTDYLGDRAFNYQPGFGMSRKGAQVTSIQGLFTVKYRL